MVGGLRQMATGQRLNRTAVARHSQQQAAGWRRRDAGAVTTCFSAAGTAVAQLDDEEVAASVFCGTEGTVLDRPAPAGGARNGKSYYVHTMGCQMNMSDSERMAGVLESAGYVCATDPAAADVLVYNTCSIREKAENKVYSALGKEAKRKRQNMGGLKIVVAGCVAQQEGQALLRRVPEVDIVMGPQFANKLHTLLEQADQGQQVCATEQIALEEDVTTPRRESAVTGWVNVIAGCNEACTYCVVPFTRGKVRAVHSRQAHLIEGDADAAAASLCSAFSPPSLAATAVVHTESLLRCAQFKRSSPLCLALNHPRAPCRTHAPCFEPRRSRAASRRPSGARCWPWGRPGTGR